MFMRRAARDLDARCLGWNPRLSSLELVNWTVEAVSFLPLPFCPAANFLLRWSSLPVHHRIPESGATRNACGVAAYWPYAHMWACGVLPVQMAPLLRVL